MQRQVGGQYNLNVTRAGYAPEEEKTKTTQLILGKSEVIHWQAMRKVVSRASCGCVTGPGTQRAAHRRLAGVRGGAGGRHSLTLDLTSSFSLLPSLRVARVP